MKPSGKRSPRSASRKISLDSSSVKMKLKKGDKVLVIAGAYRHKIGVIERVLPRTNQAVVGGVNQVKKHLKRSAKSPQGGVVTIVKPIHLSNLMLLDDHDQPTRIGYKETKAGKLRIAKLSGLAVNEKDKGSR